MNKNSTTRNKSNNIFPFPNPKNKNIKLDNKLANMLYDAVLELVPYVKDSSYYNTEKIYKKNEIRKMKRLLAFNQHTLFIASLCPYNTGICFCKNNSDGKEHWIASIIADEKSLIYYRKNPLGYDISVKSYDSKFRENFTHYLKELYLLTPSKKELFVKVETKDIREAEYIIGFSEGENSESTEIIAKSVVSNGKLDFMFF